MKASTKAPYVLLVDDEAVDVFTTLNAAVDERPQELRRWEVRDGDGAQVAYGEGRDISYQSREGGHYDA